MERTFYHWYESLSQDVQEKIPIHDRNKLALGRYHLGRIIIDETFLNFHNDIDAWRQIQNFNVDGTMKFFLK